MPYSHILALRPQNSVQPNFGVSGRGRNREVALFKTPLTTLRSRKAPGMQRCWLVRFALVFIDYHDKRRPENGFRYGPTTNVQQAWFVHRDRKSSIPRAIYFIHRHHLLHLHLHHPEMLWWTLVQAFPSDANDRSHVANAETIIYFSTTRNDRLSWQHGVDETGAVSRINDNNGTDFDSGSTWRSPSIGGNELAGKNCFSPTYLNEYVCAPFKQSCKRFASMPVYFAPLVDFLCSWWLPADESFPKNWKKERSTLLFPQDAVELVEFQCGHF